MPSLAYLVKCLALLFHSFAGVVKIRLHMQAPLLMVLAF